MCNKTLKFYFICNHGLSRLKFLVGFKLAENYSANGGGLGVYPEILAIRA